MELVINISEEDYKAVSNKVMTIEEMFETVDGRVIRAIVKGRPLPKGHGRLIDKDHMIARLEAASKFFGGENADAFDERFSHGLKEAVIKVAEEPTIIEADQQESEEES